jgi:hypothetical protein
MRGVYGPPPPESGLSHWSTRTLADHLKGTEGSKVSFHYVARVWREEHPKPHRSGTFKLSEDPAFAEKVADVVGLYLDPPGGAVVLSVDEKTQVQALDRTQPVLPVAFAAIEKRTHDYVHHGTTNLLADRQPRRDSSKVQSRALSWDFSGAQENSRDVIHTRPRRCPVLHKGERGHRSELQPAFTPPRTDPAVRRIPAGCAFHSRLRVLPGIRGRKGPGGPIKQW